MNGLSSKRRELTPKQKLFVAEYQRCWNATRAACRAGFSAKTAKEKGYELIHKNSLVKEAIERAVSENLRKVGVHSERVLTELARVALSDLRNVYNEDGRLKLPSEWSDEAAAAVAGVEVTEEFQGKGLDRVLTGYTKKVRTYDKVRALELLSKHLGIIGNGKHRDEDEDEGGERVLTPLELSAKMFYYLEIMVKRNKEIEAQKALSGKSRDEKPKELLK